LCTACGRAEAKFFVQLKMAWLRARKSSSVGRNDEIGMIDAATESLATSNQIKDEELMRRVTRRMLQKVG